MKEYTDNWTKEEFKAFLMLYIANADLKVSNDEVFAILDTVDEEAYSKLVMIHSKCNDYECITIIKENRDKHFPGEEGKEILLNELTKIAHADDKFSVYEENMIRSLKRLI